MGVGPFKKEGNGLKPLRGYFPSWPPEGARALRGLKDRVRGGLWGRGGSSRGGQGPEDTPQLVSGSEAAAVTSLCHRLWLLGGWGGGRRRSEGLGSQGRGAARPGCRGGERGERGEAVKGTEAENPESPAPRPACTPGPAGPPPTRLSPTPPDLRPAPDLRSPGPHLPPPQQPPLLEGVGEREEGLGAQGDPGWKGFQRGDPVGEGAETQVRARVSAGRGGGGGPVSLSGRRARWAFPSQEDGRRAGRAGWAEVHSPSGCSLRTRAGRKEGGGELGASEAEGVSPAPSPQPSRQHHSLLIFLLFGVRHPGVT